jgi:hypothetical protein
MGSTLLADEELEQGDRNEVEADQRRHDDEHGKRRNCMMESTDSRCADVNF